MARALRPEDDRAYYRERAAEERDAAAAASCMVKDVHLELAELYEASERSGLPPAPGSVQGSA